MNINKRERERLRVKVPGGSIPIKLLYCKLNSKLSNCNLHTINCLLKNRDIVLADTV